VKLRICKRFEVGAFNNPSTFVLIVSGMILVDVTTIPLQSISERVRDIRVYGQD